MTAAAYSCLKPNEFTWKFTQEHTMPYILAWILGVPAIILVLIWLFMH
jgi:hypothetical protein